MLIISAIARARYCRNGTINYTCSKSWLKMTSFHAFVLKTHDISSCFYARSQLPDSMCSVVCLIKFSCKCKLFGPSKNEFKGRNISKSPPYSTNGHHRSWYECQPRTLPKKGIKGNAVMLTSDASGERRIYLGNSLFFLFAIETGMSPYARQTGWVKNKNNIHDANLYLICFRFSVYHIFAG